ncbi:hypothetical protein ABPG72_019848 [Tetrahymena utriculariae]
MVSLFNQRLNTQLQVNISMKINLFFFDNNPYVQVNILIDEIIQVTSSQFSTLPLILALVNITFSALLFFGFFCKKFSNKSFLQDCFCIFLQNMHQNLYEEVLKQNNLFEQSVFSTEIQTKLNKIFVGYEISDKVDANSINIAQLITKSREYVEQSQQIQLNNTLVKYQDEVLQPEEDKNSPTCDKLQSQEKEQTQKNQERINTTYLNKEENEDNFLSYFLFITDPKQKRFE